MRDPRQLSMIVRLYNVAIMEALHLIRVKIGRQNRGDVLVMHGGRHVEHLCRQNIVQLRRVDFSLCCEKLAIVLPAFQNHV